MVVVPTTCATFVESLTAETTCSMVPWSGPWPAHGVGCPENFGVFQCADHCYFHLIFFDLDPLLH